MLSCGMAKKQKQGDAKQRGPKRGEPKKKAGVKAGAAAKKVVSRTKSADDETKRKSAASTTSKKKTLSLKRETVRKLKTKTGVKAGRGAGQTATTCNTLAC